MIAVPLVTDPTATTLFAIVSASPSASMSPSTPVSAPVSAPAAAPASAQLTVFPTSSAHPDYLSIAVFVVIFALLLGFAYAVRVLRRRLHRA